MEIDCEQKNYINNLVGDKVIGQFQYNILVFHHQVDLIDAGFYIGYWCLYGLLNDKIHNIPNNR